MAKKRYIRRSIELVLKRAAGEFPAVMLTGPRQTGKTTSLKQVFADSHRYVSFEPPDVREAAQADPRGFLGMYAPPVIFDEIQHAPELLPYIKDIIDSNRTTPGQYILTGSQNLLLMEKAKESLAGRAAILHLLPLTHRETMDNPEKPLPWEKGGTADNQAKRRKDDSEKPRRENLWMDMIRGGYPELVANPGRDIHLWHASYVATYLERDVRSIKQIGDLGQFQSFLRLLAARSGNLLNISGLASDLGLAPNTIKAWMSVLEATYQIIILRPYYANIGKRLIKTPKVYFTDTGTLCYLTGIKTPELASQGPLAGMIFETAVVSEIMKTYLHLGVEPVLHFWRTAKGAEVDLLIETGGKIIPIEIAATSTPRQGKANEIRKLMTDLAGKVSPGYLIHMGDTKLPMGDGIRALPWGEI